MARIITKELALKIVKKLGATPIKSSSKAHDEYLVEEGGIQLAILSIRRASSKAIGHDYLKNDLHVSPRQAKTWDNVRGAARITLRACARRAIFRRASRKNSPIF